MNLRIIPIILFAALIIGCKAKDDAGATPPGTTSAATGSDDKATTDAKPADDSKPADASGNTVVGTWTSDDASMKGAKLEFTPDGKITMNGSIPTPKGATMDIEGTYKLDGGKLTRHMVSGKMGAPPDADDKTKKQIDDFNKMAAAAPKQPDDESTITWKDKDTFSLKDKAGKEITYKRAA